MTFREKLAKEKGRNVEIECPFDFGYEEKRDCSNMRCTECWDREIPTEKTYEEGLQDAWKLAKKIADMAHEERNTILRTNNSCNGLIDIFNDFDVQEALAKLKAYEEAHEIKVGDVLLDETIKRNCVITLIAEDDEFTYRVLYGDGSGGIRSKQNIVEHYTKTGRHIDIESLLGQIRGE